MGMLRLKILDISGSRASDVEAPDDVAVNRLLVVLIERMNLPLNSPDGQLMSYKLHHRRTGSQLLDLQTLAEAGVASGDELRLQPEITAGCGSFCQGLVGTSRCDVRAAYQRRNVRRRQPPVCSARFTGGDAAAQRPYQHKLTAG
jgi:hypothetical protein